MMNAKKGNNRNISIIIILIFISALLIVTPITIIMALVYPSPMFYRNIILDSQSSQMYIDETDSANIYFVTLTPDWETNKVAFVKFNSKGEISDGPRFVENLSMEKYFGHGGAPSQTEIIDSHGSTFNITLSNPYDDEDKKAYINLTKEDRNGTVIFENKTIASHDMEWASEGGVWHEPYIVQITLCKDSKDNLHIAWTVNSGPGNYFKVFYTKVDNDGNVLKQPTRVIIYYDAALQGYIMGISIFIISIIALWVVYFFVRKRQLRNTGGSVPNKDTTYKKY